MNSALTVVAAGRDSVGLAAFAAELLGQDPTKGKTMAKAQQRGLGRIDYRNLSLREQENARAFKNTRAFYVLHQMK